MAALSVRDLAWLAAETEALLMSDELIQTTEPHDYSAWEIILTTRIDRERRDEQLRLLCTKLRQVIKHEVKMVQKNKEYQILNPPPISCYVPSKFDRNTPLRLKKKAKVPKAMLVASNHTSFKLPDDLLADAIKYVEEKLQNYEMVCEYSLLERLEGWRIDRKKRSYGINFDMYFEHEKSKGKFRSIAEVINFILQEAYPEKKDSVKQCNLEEDPLVPPGFEEPGKYPILTWN